MDEFIKGDPTMNNAKIQQIMSYLQEEIGEGIISASIYTANDGQSLGGINSNLKGAALLSRVTVQLTAAVKAAGFKGMGPYYLLTIGENTAALVIPMGAYECSMMFDTNKAKMGLIVNVIVPHIIEMAQK